MRFQGKITAFLLVAALVVQAVRVEACPFCSAVSLTFAQEIAQSQAAVIARLVEGPPAGSLSPRAEGPLPKGRFVVVEVLKGSTLVEEAGLLGADAKPIETILLEAKPAGSLYLLMGVEPPNIVWSSPIPVSDRAVEYLRALGSLPEKGSDRLAFFQKHLEDADETLARDAYDEFAVAPYDDVRGLESRMDPTQLLEWIENPKVQPSRRRLYATMLGVCGTKADAERIAEILKGENLPPEKADVRSGLDALIACYVTLRGAEGLDLVDRLFLDRKGRDVPFTETYAAVMALRFLGEESAAVPRDRVLRSLRILLDEPKLADLVIADLARWEDWSAIDRMVNLFANADADNLFVREPVVNYLRACPLPEAAAAIAKLEKIDPEAVRRAATLAGLAGAVAAAKPDDDGEAGAGLPSAGQPVDATADDADLATRIAPVIGDEGDGAAGEPEAPANQPETPRSRDDDPYRSLKWLAWAAVVALVALTARSALRSSSGPGPTGK
ncbi:MAG: hypothetical protein EBR28_06635 [Planctomycetia bacterium]|nr:hypothetical protein [Planctomycetia bacterium]